MSIINSTYFFGDLTIAQASQPEVSRTIQAFINKYEPLFLKEVLGYQLSKDFIAGIADTDSIDPKWDKILSGSEYTDTFGNLRKWNGFKSTAPLINSPIACFVYYWYQRDNETTTAGTGEVNSANQNATGASAVMKVSRAWQEMAENLAELYGFIEANITDYPEYKCPNYTMLGTINFAGF